MTCQTLQQLGTFGDDVVEWRPAGEDEPVCSRFSPDEWHQIADDIHSDAEWRRFVHNYDFVHPYICSLKANRRAIGFVYLFEEEPPKPVVSFHGGCWDKTHPLVCSRGITVLIDRLLSKGVRVRTSCSNRNTNAFRFLKAIGGVPYYKGERYTYMWINARRLCGSPIYRRINRPAN